MQRTIQNLSTNYYILFVFFAAVLLSSCKQEEGYFKVADIEVSFLSNIDNQPRISWKVKSDSANFIQSASRILIADNLDDIENNNGNFWDSDKSTELNQLQVKFTEKNCESGKTYFAKIKVWDNDGTESRWSEIKPFTIPINYPEDWAAKWITYDFHADSALPVFKKQLDIKDKEKIENVRLYIAGPSFYEAYLNNKKIGSNVLDPAQTNFEDYTYYTVYDIEKERIEENNVLGVMIGKGWYNQDIVWRKMTYGQPVFIAQVVVTYKDGTTHKIGTDDTWLWKHGPITFSNIYAGETYDANKEVDDWFSTTHNKAWKTALLSKEHPVELFEQFAEPIKKMEVIATKQILERDSSVYIFDFGQNFSGWLKLKMKGKKNQQITIECYEELDSNGVPDPRTTGIRATKVIQTQTYICRGEGVEEWEPRFTYFGFRYAKVSGLDAKPNKDMLSGIVLYSSLKKTGSFECSEENINKLHQLSDWTVKGNLHGVPTDCPQREKCGWTGDAHALAKTLFYNYDGQLFMNKYVFDLRSSGRKEEKQLTFGKDFHDRKVRIKPKGIPTMIVPGKRTCGTAAADWGTAMTQVPWYLYVWYGEKELLQNFYPDMKVWVEYIKDKELDGIIAHGLGDWCPPGGNRNKDTPVPLSSTIFHIIDLNIMAKTAKVLGFEDDVKYYEGLHKKMCTAFNKQFFDSINYTYGTQTANSMALDANVVPDSLKRKVAAAIVKDIHENHDGFISTGIFGIARIFNVLAENGFEDEAYRLFAKKGNNSFAFMWEHFDATTLWEVLQLTPIDDEELHFRSHSHPMQAGYDSWFYSGIGGIVPNEAYPGFQQFILKPMFTTFLNHASVSYESGYGIIVSNWKNNDATLSWEVSIPENSKAEIFIPNYGKDFNITENGKASKAIKSSTNFTSIGIYSSGTYNFEIKMQ